MPCIGLLVSQVDVCYPIIACTVYYWLVGMADDFPTYLWYLGTNCVMLLAANSFGVFIGCTVRNFQYSMTMLAVCGLYMLALSGFMIKDRAIPEWIRWMKYFSFMRYGYLGGLYTTLSYVEFDCDENSTYDTCLEDDTDGYIDGNILLNEFGVEEPYWMCMALLVGLTSLYFSVAYVNLRRTTTVEAAKKLVE